MTETATDRVLGISDIAAALEISSQAVSKRMKEQPSWLPAPDLRGPGERPLWYRKTLEAAGSLTKRAKA